MWLLVLLLLLVQVKTNIAYCIRNAGMCMYVLAFSHSMNSTSQRVKSYSLPLLIISTLLVVVLKLTVLLAYVCAPNSIPGGIASIVST